MPVSDWSAPVTGTTPAAPVTLVVDSATQAQTAEQPTVHLVSDWSAAVGGTTLSGTAALVVSDAVQAQTSGGTQTPVGFGQGGFGSTPFGGTPGAGADVVIEVIAAPPPPPPPPEVRPATWTWNIGPWRTGPEMKLSRARNRKATWRLIGRSEASFDLDGTDEAAAAVDELVSDLWLLRTPASGTAACLFRGRVGRTEDDIDGTAHTVSVSVGDYRAVLDRRQLWDGGQLSWLNTDQAGIAFGLLQHTQAQPGGGMGIVQGAGRTTGVVRVRNDYPAGKKVGEAIDQLSQVIDGFDWDITPAADPRDPAMTLDVFYPSRGTDRQTVLALGNRVAKITRTVDPGEFANAERGTGAETTAAGAALLPVRREASDIATRPEGRWDGAMSDPDLKIQQTITERTAQELAARQTITPDWSVTLAPNSWAGPEDIWLGDPVILVVKSGRLDVVASYRVMEIAAAWDEEDNVTPTLALAAVTRANRRWTLRRVDQRLQNLERR